MNQPAAVSIVAYTSAELGRDLTPRDVPGKPPRQPLAFAALCALDGAVVTRDEQRGIVMVTFRGRYAGQGNLTADEVNAMLTADKENDEHIG